MDDDIPTMMVTAKLKPFAHADMDPANPTYLITDRDAAEVIDAFLTRLRQSKALATALRELTDAAKQITPLLTDQNVHALRLKAAIEKAEGML